MEMDQSDFIAWMEHPITTKLMEIMSDNELFITEKMLNPEIILANEGKTEVARMVGQRDIISLFLNLSYDDFKPADEEKDVNERVEKKA